MQSVVQSAVVSDFDVTPMPIDLPWLPMATQIKFKSGSAPVYLNPLNVIRAEASLFKKLFNTHLFLVHLS